MIGFHPLALTGLIIAAVSLTGMIVAMVRNARKFHGYEDIVKDANNIAQKLHGQIFRDGDDLVISGNHENLPTIVRLSHAENTPGLSIEMRVPAKFRLTVMPKENSTGPDGIPMNLGLPTGYAASTSSSFEAGQLLGAPPVKRALAHICQSSKFYLEISPERLLISELLIPELVCERVLAELACASLLATELEKFPGADLRKIIPLRHDRSSWKFRGALAAGVIVTIAGIAQNGVNASNRSAAVPVKKSSAIPRIDAVLLPHIDDWRLAEASDFDSRFVSWMQEYGLNARHVLDFSSDQSRRQDARAYFLVNDKGERRIAIFVDHRVLFDTIFPAAEGIAVVPMDSVDKIQWPMSRVPFDRQKVSGDGLLVVRNLDKTDGALLLFFANNNMYSGAPENFQHIDLQ